MITTTLEKIRSRGPCQDGWDRLLRHLGKTKADNDILPLSTVLESNGYDDALWCLRAVDGHDREIRLFAVWCARSVEHLSQDPRVKAATDVAERYAGGDATESELGEARAAAWAADAAAREAADAAADAAAWAAGSAAREADAAAGAATVESARAAQTVKFREMVS